MSIQSEIDRIKAGKADIRAAIVEKGQSVPATASLSSYGDKIRAIQTGVDTSDATAVAGDILSGKTAYVKGSKVTGNIASKGAADLTASGAAVSVPAGYYPATVSKSVAAATQATPSITVSSAGKITASATQSAGYVAAGTKSATKQLTTQAAATITPGTAEKTAVASGTYTTGAVKVAGDANLIASNIKSGVSIFGVAGTYEASGNAGNASYRVTVNGDSDWSITYPKSGPGFATTSSDKADPLLGIVFTAVGAFYVSVGDGSPYNRPTLNVDGGIAQSAGGSGYLVLPTSSFVTVTVN